MFQPLLAHEGLPENVLLHLHVSKNYYWWCQRVHSRIQEREAGSERESQVIFVASPFKCCKCNCSVINVRYRKSVQTLCIVEHWIDDHYSTSHHLLWFLVLTFLSTLYNYRFKNMNVKCCTLRYKTMMIMMCSLTYRPMFPALKYL